MNRIHAPDGTPLVYDEYEPSAVETRLAVLFFHGWGPEDSAERWAGLCARLRERRVAAYALDQRGHGRSGGVPLHLTRFSQLLGDLQAFRRVVRRRRDVPQLLVGHGFGGLVVLRYLETQPGEPPLGAIVANPWLASRQPPTWWRRVALRLADLWPTLALGSGAERVTAGAAAEIGWAQRAVIRDVARIESPVLIALSADDPVADLAKARELAQRLAGEVAIVPGPELSPDAIVTFATSRLAHSSERLPKDE